MVSWNVKGGGGIGPAPFLVSGVLNVTPDSFFDGGRFQKQDAAVTHAGLMLEHGAHIIDIGGESTRPFSDRVDVGEEKSRVLPVLKKILEKYPHAKLSIDTYKAEVAIECLNAGAVIINDVSACRYDPGLVEVLAEHKPGYVLMHSQGRPETMQKEPKYQDVIAEVKYFFEKRINYLTANKLPEDRIVLDPGIGFGKTLEHNLELLRRIRELSTFGFPLYLGLSNKSFWGKLLGLETEQRGTATQIGVALSAARGVGIHRVHDVPETFNTLKIVEKIWF